DPKYLIGNLLLEDEEKRFLGEEGIIVRTSSDISEETILEMLSWATLFPHLHISFDIDVFLRVSCLCNRNTKSKWVQGGRNLSDIESIKKNILQSHLILSSITHRKMALVKL